MTKSSGYKLDLSASQLMAAARDKVGVDIVDDMIRESMEVLVKALNEEAEMTRGGAEVTQQKLLRILCNRLRMMRDYARHPEIHDQPLKDPIFLVGMVRTGSTKTQKLLASSGDFNYLTYWKSMNFASWTGVPNESVDGRIAEIEEYEAWYDKASPENKTGHAMETHEPEEEFCILMQSGFDGSYYGFYHVPSFLDWVAKQPPEIKEEYLRDALKYLQWQGLADPNKRWMLKSPMHNGSEEALLKAFPDATLIMTHREPTSTVPSACKLNTHLKKVFSDRPVEYANTAGFLAAQMDSHIQFKATHPDIPILDIYYTDVIDDVAATMQRIYDFCHEPLSEASLRRILEWDAANPKNKHGAFKYSPEEFGFTNESIQAQFGEYYEFLKARFPDKVS